MLKLRVNSVDMLIALELTLSSKATSERLTYQNTQIEPCYFAVSKGYELNRYVRALWSWRRGVRRVGQPKHVRSMRSESPSALIGYPQGQGSTLALRSFQITCAEPFKTSTERSLQTFVKSSPLQHLQMYTSSASGSPFFFVSRPSLCGLLGCFGSGGEASPSSSTQ